MLISFDMGIFTTLQLAIDDYLLWIRQHKIKFLASILLVILGVIVGVVLFVKSNGNWWYANRCSYANLLVCGNLFVLLLSILLQMVIICGVMMLGCCIKYSAVVNYILLFVCALYSGANIACIFSLVGVLAVFYALLFTLMELFCFTFVVYQEDCQTVYLKRIGECYADCKNSLFAVVLLTFVKILLLFLILRPLSASI